MPVASRAQVSVAGRAPVTSVFILAVSPINMRLPRSGHSNSQNVVKMAVLVFHNIRRTTLGGETR